jgi:hypothetical protein
VNFDDELLEQLILDGIIEFSAMSSDGEMLYSFSTDIAEKAPAIYELMMAMHMQEIYELWKLGFLQMDITQENPLVTITTKALDEEQVGELSKPLRMALTEIMDAMRKGE